MSRTSQFFAGSAILVHLACSTALAQEADAGVGDVVMVDASTLDSTAEVVSEEPEEQASASIAERLRAIYSQIDDLSGVNVGEEAGVVRLEGEVPSSEDAEHATEIARSFEGVVYVNNQLSEPIAIRDRVAPLAERFEAWTATFVENLPIYGIAALIVFLGLILSKFVRKWSWPVRHITTHRMTQEILQRILSFAVFLLALLVALEILDATAVVGAALGAVGVLGIALGFAFQSIVENYLASFLLAIRRPFAPGDEIQIDDKTGKVVRLTMRDTILMTLDGNHLSFPNAVVFKAIITNFTRNPKRRFDFGVGAGTDTDLVEAQQLTVETLLATQGVLSDPKPFCWIEELGDSNVLIQAHGWVDQNEADFFKVRGNAIRRVKVALENAGIDMPEPIYRVHLKDMAKAPIEKAHATTTELEHQDDVSVDNHLEEQIRESESGEAQENLIAGEENPPGHG